MGQHRDGLRVSGDEALLTGWPTAVLPGAHLEMRGTRRGRHPVRVLLAAALR